jgi:peptidoglycan/LPS O-acetylase OafA/YrhL
MEFSAPHWEKRPPLPVLTSLRFFAATAVVVYHAANHRFRASAHLDIAAYEAVAFFFVLSGFVLVYANVDAPNGRMKTSLGRFWWSRVARLTPAYYVALLLIAPFLFYGFFVAGTINMAGFLIAIAAGIAFVPAPFVSSTLAWNPPSWSLGVEVCLYAVFPWLLRACFRWSIRPTIVATATTLLLSFGLRAALLRFDDASTDFLYRFPLFYFPHFAVGVTAARYFLFEHKLSEMARSIMFTTGLVGILATGATANWTYSHPNWIYPDIAFTPLAALLIVGGTATAAWPGRLLSSRPLVILGEASYAIYILHWPLRPWISQIVKRVPAFGTTQGSTSALYLVVVLLTAVATYFVVERPARHYLISKASGVFRRPNPE